MTQPPSYLSDFEAAISRVWAAYQTQGPGRLSAEELEPIENALAGWDADSASLPDDLVACVQQLYSLAQRCVLRPEGLSFVTGEAGLLPRKDLHATFNESLAQLRRCLNA